MNSLCETQRESLSSVFFLFVFAFYAAAAKGTRESSSSSSDSDSFSSSLFGLPPPPEGPVRSKAVVNVRSLGREGAEASAPSPSTNDDDDDIRGSSLTRSDAFSASLLFRWVARLPKVRREGEEGERRWNERERERERTEGKEEREKAKPGAWRRTFFEARLVFSPSFPYLLHHPSLPRPTNQPTVQPITPGPALSPPGRPLHAQEEQVKVDY